MTYAEMLADLEIITNRPDLQSDLAVALRRATLKMHGLEFWKFDLQPATLSIATPSYLMTIDTTTLTRFRQMSWIKASDPSVTDQVETSYNGQALPWYDPADPNRLMNEYGRSLTNVYYTAGNTIHIRSSVAPAQLYIGYYKRPIVTPVGAYTSWIADNYPYAIIDEAARQIFDTIGLDKKTNLYKEQVTEHVQILKTNYLEDQAR